MHFKKYFHQWLKNDSSFNEARLVFLALPAPKWKEFAEVEKLPTEYVHGQNLLGNRIEQLRADISIREGRAKTEKVIVGKFGREKEGLAELKEKKEACKQKLEQLKSPVRNHEEFKTAIDEVSIFNRTLSRIRSVDLDQADVGNLLISISDISPLSPFFSPELSAKLDLASKRMVTTDKALNEVVSQSNDPLLVHRANTEWKEEGKRLKTELKNLKKERKRLEKIKKPTDEEQKELKEIKDTIQNTEAELKNKTNWINRRTAQLQAEQDLQREKNENLAYLEGKKAKDEILEAKRQDENYIELVHRQMEDEKALKERTHSLTRQIENQNIIAVANKLDYEAKLELTNILLEAKEIRQAEILKYFEAQYQKARDRFDKIHAKKPPRFNKKEEERIKESLDKAETIFLHAENLFKTDLENPELATQKVEAVNSMLVQQLGEFQEMDKQLEFFDEFDKDPETLKAKIQRKFENVKFSIQEFTPERVDQLVAELDKIEKERIESLKPEERTKYDEFGKSVVHQKQKTALLELKKPDSPLKKQMAEVEPLIQKIDELNPEELADLKLTLDKLQEKLLGFSGKKIDQALNPEKMEDAIKARLVINQLSGETDINKIKEILDENLGSKYVEYVSEAVFEKKYRPYTATGFMVFYERGKEWKIIINEDALEDGKALQNQLTHELLHLEFEKNDDLKKKWLELFTQNKNWSAIKQTFIDTFPDKQPPAGEEWRDEDVLSEIFAMQKEIFKDDTPFPELSKAILGSGITAETLGIDQEMIRGYEGAEDIGSIMSEAEGGETVSEAEGVASAEVYKERIERLQGEIQNMLDSDYLSYLPGAAGVLRLMKDFNDDTAKLNDKFEETKIAFLGEIIEDRLKQVDKDLKEIGNKIAEVSEKMPNDVINPLRNIWNKTTFLSLYDIFQVGVDIKEWMQRRHNRKKADHAAKFGMALFQNMPLPLLSEFGAEAAARKEKAELEEVNEWKSRFENTDAWVLLDILRKMSDEWFPNVDQFKAILRILAERGRIDWRNKYIWKLLNKLQSATSLSPNDKTLYSNPVLLRHKLHEAVGAIWDYDEFLRLERDNESNYDGNKQKYMESLNKIQDHLTERLDHLLKKFRSGERVDPMEYEAVMEYAIVKGKAYAETVMFHAIAGAAEGVIPADRPLTLDSKFLNEWPALQWIYHQHPPLTQADYKRIAKTEFGESYRNGTVGSDFMHWFWTVVQNDTYVIQRVRKSVSERKWDHDWGRSIACIGDANTAKRWLSGKSGQQEAKDTGVENAYVGALQWLEANAKDPKKIDARKLFTRQIAWISMADGIIDHVAYDRGPNDIYTRGNASILDAVAREACWSNHKEWTTRMQRDKIRAFLDRFDPYFFALLRDQTRAKSDPKGLGVAIRDYLIDKYPTLTEEVRSVTHLDHIFEKMDAIIKGIIAATSDDKLYDNIAWLREDLGPDAH